MYTSNALTSQGFKLEIGDTGDSPMAPMTEIKEITSFDFFDGQAAEIDRTHLQSPAKEFIMGLQDFGNANVDLNYLPTDPGQSEARAAKGTGVLKRFKATFSDGSTAEYTGYVLSSPISGGVDGKIDSSFAIRVSGDVDFTP